MERWKEILLRGREDGLHLGGQLAVRLRGELVIDFSFGEAREGGQMRPDSLVPWFSSGKPLTLVLLAQLVERGQVSWDDLVSKHIPEFARNGKERITLKHLLTHTAAFRSADKISADTPWAEMLTAICEAPLEDDWVPGQKAGYSTGAAWYVLAEIIQRITGEIFDAYARKTLLEPLGMNDSWLRLPFSNLREYGDRVALIYETGLGRRQLAPLQDAAALAQCRPGSSARGPIRELALFYEMLLNASALKGRRFLNESTIEFITRPHRVGMFDHTFMHTIDYGLGFILNSNRYGVETVPYGYGRHASELAFGHSGAQSSCAFADPAHKLVIAWAVNGMPGERPHQKRHRELNSAIYQELGLADPAR